MCSKQQQMASSTAVHVGFFRLNINTVLSEKWIRYSVASCKRYSSGAWLKICCSINIIIFFTYASVILVCRKQHWSGFVKPQIFEVAIYLLFSGREGCGHNCLTFARTPELSCGQGWGQKSLQPLSTDLFAYSKLDGTSRMNTLNKAWSSLP